MNSEIPHMPRWQRFDTMGNNCRLQNIPAKEAERIIELLPELAAACPPARERTPPTRTAPKGERKPPKLTTPRRAAKARMPPQSAAAPRASAGSLRFEAGNR